MSPSFSWTGWRAAFSAIRTATIFRAPCAFRQPRAFLRSMPAAGGAHWGFVLALFIAVAVWFMLSRTLKGFEVRVLGGSPRAGRFAGFSCEPHGVLRLPAFRRACRPGGHYRSGRADRPAARGGVARLRVHGDHRGLPRPPQSARHHRRRPDPRTDLSRAARQRRYRLAFPTRRRAYSRACCCSSCSAATRSSITASDFVGFGAAKAAQGA